MSSFLERVRARMAGGEMSRPLFERPPAKERSRNTISTNRWDDQVWKTARSTDAVDHQIHELMVGDVHTEGDRKGYELAPELIHDVFMSFYKAAPKVLPKREVEKASQPVRDVIKEMLDNPRLKDLQAMTSSDPAMSLIALSAMNDTITEIVNRIPPERPDNTSPGQPNPGGQGGSPGGPTAPGPPQGGNQQQPQQPQPGQPGDDEGDGDDPTEGDYPDTEPDDIDPDEVDDEPDDIDDDEYDPESEPRDPTEERDWKDDVERLVNRAIDEASKEAEELESARKNIGLDQGSWEAMSPEERLAMAERLTTPEMKTLADIVGRMKRFALGVKAQRVNDVPHEAFDVEQGNDVRRLLRSEFGLLGTKETTYEFYRKYAERELLQFKMRGHEEAGKGPIVIAIDKSGSMHGQPFNWALGVAEALRRFAAEEDRDYFAYFFGNNNDRNAFNFPQGKGPFEKVLAFLSVDANGGTQFDGVLDEALEKASTSFDGEGRGKADIVFITDGMAHLDDAWIKKFNEERERVGVRVYSVYIGGARDMTRNGGPVGLLSSISDIVIPVSDLRPEAAQKIFQMV